MRRSQVAKDVRACWPTVATAAVLLLAFGFQLARVAQTWSATWDEPHHLLDGYTVATRGDYRLNTEVPPLLKVVAALPLLSERLSVPADPSHDMAFREGRSFVFENGPARTLMPARAVCALFALALAVLVGWTAWRRFGAAAGLIALALITFDPTVLANGPLVTTDIGSALFIFATVMAFHRAARSPRRIAWTLGAGVLCGLAMCTKFTGLLLAPVLVCLAGWEGLRARDSGLLIRRLLQAAAVGFVGWCVIWAFYRFTSAPGPLLAPSLSSYLASLPNAADAKRLALVARLHLLPEPYTWGLANTKITEFEDTSYLFGRVYRHGPWWYFPAAFAIKSTLPLLVLLAASPWLLRRRWGTLGAASLLLPPVIYFVIVSGSHFDIGVRHLLPVYPFLYVLVAGAAAVLARRGRWGAVLAGGLVAWQVIGCLLTWPAYMAFGNEAWGGPAQVHRYLSDANVDWGQQLKAVRAYLDARGENGHCWFAYFPDGAIEPSDYGVRCRRLPTTENLWWLKLPMDVPPVITGPVLISASDLASFEFGPGELNPYAGFTNLNPAAVLQGGVDVYDGRFAVPLAAALVKVRSSLDKEAQGDFVGALASAQEAADLAPRSARTQLRLGEMLMRVHRPKEAAAHLTSAAELVREIRPDLESAEMNPKIDAAQRTLVGLLSLPPVTGTIPPKS